MKLARSRTEWRNGMWLLTKSFITRMLSRLWWLGVIKLMTLIAKHFGVSGTTKLYEVKSSFTTVSLVKYFRPNPKTDHYTQMVWGETTHIGCGLILGKYDHPGKGPCYYHHLVCNYAPAGNIQGDVIYEAEKNAKCFLNSTCANMLL